MANNVIQFTVKGQGGQQAGSTFSKVAKGIGLVAGAMAAFKGLKAVASASISFEKLRLSINTVSKSAADARANMKMIEEFAAKTPFDLNQVTEGFIKLKALGLDPSEAAMTSYGNTASAMGKSLNQMVEAVADAATGEFERLKEFGIKAKKEGDNVKFTFQGVTTQIENNADAINGYLMSIGENQFAGAMATQANSVVGAVSNMKDNFNRLAVAIGDAGIRPLIKAAALQMSKFAQVLIDAKPKIQAFITTLVTIGLMIALVIKGVVAKIKALFDGTWREALNKMWESFKSVFNWILDFTIKIWGKIGKVFIKALPIILTFLKDSFKNAFVTVGKLMINLIVTAISFIGGVITEFGSALVDEIKSWFDGSENDFFNNFGEGLASEFQKVGEGLKTAGVELGEGVVEGLGLIGDAVGDLVDSVGPEVESIIDAYKEAGGEASDFVLSLTGYTLAQIQAMAEGYTAAADAMQDKAEEVSEVLEESNLSLIELLAEYWGEFIESVDAQWTDFIDKRGTELEVLSKLAIKIGKDVAKTIGKAFASAIVDGKNLMKSFKTLLKDVAKSIISALVEIGVQRIISSLLAKTAAGTEASSTMSANLGTTFTGQMSAMSQAPFPVNLTAPAIAAAMTGVAAAGGAAAMATGAGIGATAAAHGGLTNVPKESTYLLDKGERVLSPNQNRDFTDFLGEDRGGGQSIVIENIQMSVLENITDGDAFLNLSDEEVKEVVADKIIVALDALDNEGTRPAFADREINS